jgi:hypothetical protein
MRELREEPRLWTVGPAALGAGCLLPVHDRLQLYAGGKPLWPWRSAMFKHNKRAKRGAYRRIRPHAMHRLKRPVLPM